MSKELTIYQFVLLLAVACSSTPAERVQYGLGAIKLACQAEEKHPEIAADLPPDAKAELDAICPVVATAGP